MHEQFSCLFANRIFHGNLQPSYFEINYKVLFHIEARVQKLNLNVSYLIQLKKVRASVLYFSDM